MLFVSHYYVINYSNSEKNSFLATQLWYPNSKFQMVQMKWHSSQNIYSGGIELALGESKYQQPTSRRPLTFQHSYTQTTNSPMLVGRWGQDIGKKIQEIWVNVKHGPMRSSPSLQWRYDAATIVAMQLHYDT